MLKLETGKVQELLSAKNRGDRFVLLTFTAECKHSQVL